MRLAKSYRGDSLITVNEKLSFLTTDIDSESSAHNYDSIMKKYQQLAENYASRLRRVSGNPAIVCLRW